MISLWWLATPVLLLPIWWHRQKRERAASQPLATARFLPRTDPLHRRVWRWDDPFLLLLRCLLLATVIAWLADLVLPWRGDAVLVAPGSDPAWAEQQMKDAGFAGAARIDLADRDVFGWLSLHEREWKPDARLLVVGPASMPAALPRIGRDVTVRPAPLKYDETVHRVSIVSKQAAKSRAMFAALGGPQRYVIQDGPVAPAELVIWDTPEAPPAGLKAALWWVGDTTAFPELKSAPAVDGVRHANSARGRLWQSDAWPAGDAETARAQFETWQRLHYPPLPWTPAAQLIAASQGTSAQQASGALRYWLTITLLSLFVLERIVAHAKRR